MAGDIDIMKKWNDFGGEVSVYGCQSCYPTCPEIYPIGGTSTTGTSINWYPNKDVNISNVKEDCFRINLQCNNCGHVFFNDYPKGSMVHSNGSYEKENKTDGNTKVKCTNCECENHVRKII